MDIKELKDASGNVIHTLAKIRNPWSREAYHGPWSDNDSRWTDDFKKQVDHKVANDGVIYLPYSMLVEEWDWVSAAITDPALKQNIVQVEVE